MGTHTIWNQTSMSDAKQGCYDPMSLQYYRMAEDIDKIEAEAARFDELASEQDYIAKNATKQVKHTSTSTTTDADGKTHTSTSTWYTTEIDTEARAAAAALRDSYLDKARRLRNIGKGLSNAKTTLYKNDASWGRGFECAVLKFSDSSYRYNIPESEKCQQDSCYREQSWPVSVEWLD